VVGIFSLKLQNCRTMTDGIAFHLLRCGTSRGPFFWGSALPPEQAERDALLCGVMGSGTEGQVDGIGGGTGVTSKAVFLNRAEEGDEVDVEFNFAQVGVKVRTIDHSHGDCMNMFAGVTPFVLATAADRDDRGTSAERPLRVRSMETGMIAEQWIASEGSGDGGAVLRPGRPCKVESRIVGCSGSMTGSVLPAGGAAMIELEGGLPRVSVVDFSRVTVIVAAADVGMTAGTKMDDPALCARLEAVRVAAAKAAGLGDCSDSDSPKLCVVAAVPEDEQKTSTNSAGAVQLRAWYWVNPGRCEPHPTMGITCASCLAAACELPGTIPHALLRAAAAAPAEAESGGGGGGGGGGVVPEWSPAAGVTTGDETVPYGFQHPQGVCRVTLWRRQAGAAPHGVAYSNSVRILASGQLFVDDTP
jgi:4-oxalomesaconate tautomerase